MYSFFVRYYPGFDVHTVNAILSLGFGGCYSSHPGADGVRIETDDSRTLFLMAGYLVNFYSAEVRPCNGESLKALRRTAGSLCQAIGVTL
jgi:hypothetical protein